MPDSTAPTSFDVLVIGAGPAGSACAQLLARAGQRVALVDQHAFPRDKVCGDGLIPDALAAFKQLGVFDEVMAAAQAASHVACIAPRGGRVDVPGDVAVLPRRMLDDILYRAALRAGAVALPPARFMALLREGDAPGARVAGVQLKRGDVLIEQRARWIVLATGASAPALIAAGVCQRRAPTGMALRGYIESAAMVAKLTALEVVWHPRLRGGYGWIFPAPGGVFNIGVGLAHSHEEGVGMKDVNLRDLFSAFCEVYAPARELLAQGRWVGELKGAPLRCSLDGARFSAPGLLVTGEAAGSTYAFTGEGIGKAMETGMLAAQALFNVSGDSAVQAQYEAAVLALKPRFDLYERANRVNAHPWLADLLIWRARGSPGLIRRMSGVLNETSNPGNLVTLRGVMKLFLPLR